MWPRSAIRPSDTSTLAWAICAQIRRKRDRRFGHAIAGGKLIAVAIAKAVLLALEDGKPAAGIADACR